MVAIAGEYSIVPSIDAFVWIKKDGLVWPKCWFDNEELWAIRLLSEYTNYEGLSDEFSRRLGQDYSEIVEKATKRMNVFGFTYDWFALKGLLILDHNQLSDFFTKANVYERAWKTYINYLIEPLQPLIVVAGNTIRDFLSSCNVEVSFERDRVVITASDLASRILDLYEKDFLIPNLALGTCIFIGSTDVRVVHRGSREVETCPIVLFLRVIKSGKSHIKFEKNKVTIIGDFGQKYGTHSTLEIIVLVGEAYPSIKGSFIVASMADVSITLLEADRIIMKLSSTLDSIIEAMFEKSPKISIETPRFEFPDESIDAVQNLLRDFAKKNIIHANLPIWLNIWPEIIIYKTSEDMFWNLTSSWRMAIELLASI